MTPQASALAEVGRALYDRGWLPATSGNLSVRIDADHALVTASGRWKGRLGAEDLLVLTLDGQVLSPGGRPSAETPLHLALYRSAPAIGAVLHVHSPAATALSRACPGGIRLEGWELAKAFPGVTTHEVALDVPVLPNDQDTHRLAEAAAALGSTLPGYCIAGHGLYAWGAHLDDALRHLEAFEALFHLEILSRSLR
jgi:methylthioribulose-1-phosphate dehydratase